MVSQAWGIRYQSLSGDMVQATVWCEARGGGLWVKPLGHRVFVRVKLRDHIYREMAPDGTTTSLTKGRRV